VIDNAAHEAELYEMNVIEEDGKIYAVFRNSKGELIRKIHIKQTIEQ
jgi:flagellar hook protein FlgE